MPRSMSFMATTEQVRAKTKTVTRRRGWGHLRPGDLLQPVVKCQGLKKGERQERIGGLIEVVSVVQEPLFDIHFEDVAKEGFPDWTVREFIEMFCKLNKCTRDHLVTRIEFRYVEVQP